jgi:hypothetical protein
MERRLVPQKCGRPKNVTSAELFFLDRCLHLCRYIVRNRLHSVVFSWVLSDLGHHLVIIFATRNKVAIQANRGGIS